MIFRCAGITSGFCNGILFSIDIFFQGCEKKCENCQNKSLIPKEGGFDYDTNTVIEHIYKYNDFYNSVVMLGGEPCLQMTALTHLIDNINLPIVLYTGWYYSDIPKYIRNSVDIIIDGPYIEKLRTENFPISTNQNIYVNGKLDNSDFRKTPYAKI